MPRRDASGPQCLLGLFPDSTDMAKGVSQHGTKSIPFFTGPCSFPGMLHDSSPWSFLRLADGASLPKFADTALPRFRGKSWFTCVYPGESSQGNLSVDGINGFLPGLNSVVFNKVYLHPFIGPLKKETIQIRVGECNRFAFP